MREVGVDAAQMYLWCRDTGFQKPLLCCVRCKKFQLCPAITRDRKAALMQSDRIGKIYNFSEPKRYVMFLFIKTDGSIVPAYRGFDIKNPDFSKLDDVETVVQTAKAFKKECRLVVVSEKDAAVEEAAPAARVTACKGVKKQA